MIIMNDMIAICVKSEVPHQRRDKRIELEGELET